MKTLKNTYFLLSFSAFFIIWQVVSTSGIVNRTIFPPPTDVFEALVSLTVSGELFVHINASIWRVIGGLFIGSVAGIILGLLTGRIRLIDNFLSPILQLFRSFPPVAIIPLVIVWLGIGDTAKLFLISFAVFFPVWISTHTGASGIQINYLHAAVTLTKSRFKRWFKVVLPASSPSIVIGVRMGISIAFILVFVSELAGASSGLGYLISVSQASYRMDVMISGLFVLGFLGAFTDYLFMKTINRMLPWIGKI